MFIPYPACVKMKKISFDMHALQNRTGVRVCVCVFPLVHLMEFHAPLNHFQWKNISVDRREMAVHVSSSKDFQAYF